MNVIYRLVFQNPAGRDKSPVSGRLLTARVRDDDDARSQAIGHATSRRPELAGWSCVQHAVALRD